MTMLPDSARGAVYDPDTRTIEVRSFPLRAPRPGEVLVRVALSAICGSELHTISGRRRPHGPLILGHEICGTVAAPGDGVTHDSAGAPLAVGDRVTWSIAASCGACFFCRNGIPQKCASLFKYGHESIDVDPALNGGFAEYVYLVPGTAIFRLPNTLDDDRAVFANCSLATMAAAMRTADLRAKEAVLIQGAGLVGICASALASARGARAVMVVDVDDARLERAKDFGATHVVNVAHTTDEEYRDMVHQTAGERGFDVAIEVCGRPEVIPKGVAALRIGGRYVIAGCVFPGAIVALDMLPVVTKLLRLLGLHNYTPHDLRDALGFLTGAGTRFPFHEVVAARFPLAEIDRAVSSATDQKDLLRVALTP